MALGGAERRTGKILIVDDDPVTADLLRLSLEVEGHEVRTAAEGLEGVELARAFHPDVALVDILMPGLDGYAVASAMRRDLGQAVAIIALTGLPERRARCLVSGFNLHLRKPVPLATIRDIIRALLEGRPALEGSATA